MTTSLEVRDALAGRPVAGLDVRWESQGDDGWRTAATGRTDARGRVPWPAGAARDYLVRCVLTTDAYFTSLGMTPSYPDITLSFCRIDRPRSVLVLISLRGFIFYDGCP